MKLWGGRFTQDTNSAANDFHSSLAFDCRLYKQDIAVSTAHAKMLAKQGIITAEDAEAITAGLAQIKHDIKKGKVKFDTTCEDIHMFIETLLTKRIGEPAKRLHTARSRNDQVATDIRLYIKEEISKINAMLRALITALTTIAAEHENTVMPGYTHLQKAQPITLAQHLSAYIQMFSRDLTRFHAAYTAANSMPLGACALAGTAHNIDTDFTMRELGFSRVCENTIDAVSDRDFLLDFLHAAAVLMTHLSRFSEEIVLWATGEFGFVQLSDAYATGSSIMPQKKNPDMAELTRGKTGRVYGAYIALLTVLKGLPLAYNKDMQEDKEAVFDVVDTLKICLPVFTGMVSTMRFNEQAMRQAAGRGFTNATDAADWLAANGVPFREAHEIVGRLVLYCINENKSLEELSIEEYKAVSDVLFDGEGGIYEAIDLNKCVERRRRSGEL